MCLISRDFMGGIFYWFFVSLEKLHTMKETYHLNGEVLPAMPVPHDCLIEKISVEDWSSDSILLMKLTPSISIGNRFSDSWEKGYLFA